ncbi:hypothetical protein LTR97_001057 [Elasticomyces elasticus]|uniref:UBC core domain-containing protein n=1 Tax=Elasticomyces elasticus TaxID=574655 RepID=A0AAN7WIA0_9PEZI|nr:hypothetical protein LTR97_001057 [Elasticomyces elasticus]
MALNTAALLRRRLLQDISELQSNPYPGIKLHIDDKDLKTACLVLSPAGELPLHLTVHFGDKYPLSAPAITIQSQVSHPNVFGDYICASILNTKEGYTPAYTLKAICIQLLSFFSDDAIEQVYGGVVARPKQGLKSNGHAGFRAGEDMYSCAICRFGFPNNELLGPMVDRSRPLPKHTSHGWERIKSASPAKLGSSIKSAFRSRVSSPKHVIDGSEATAVAPSDTGRKGMLIDLPNEMLILITEFLDEEDLFIAARAWNGFGRLLQTHNLLAVREMRCFTLKDGFKDTNLGVGVHVHKRIVSSEFDYLSEEAFKNLRVRRSVQGLEFEHWLPLPFSEAHWKRVRSSVDDALLGIGSRIESPSAVETLYTFMNDVVVQLSQTSADDRYGESAGRYNIYGSSVKSTLTHASEKAVESYFQLYHLLVTLATDRPQIVADANARIGRFLGGERDKTTCPNLGNLLVALLISDSSDSVELTKAIIKEAVTRNVVWMLDGRGAGMVELSYLEPSEVSEYRLHKTYEASKTSYNLLMFANLMRRTVSTSVALPPTPDMARAPASTSPPTSSLPAAEMPAVTVLVSPPSAPISATPDLPHAPVPHADAMELDPKPQRLTEIRTDLFSRHGAPPAGAAAQLAASIRSIRKVGNFPAFLKAMDVPVPSKAEFTGFLRRAVCESMDKGYSKWALKQDEALAFRVKLEPGVEIPDGIYPVTRARGHYTFFPGNGNGKGGKGGRGGRR